MADSLGEELSAVLSNITSLIIKTESKSDRTKLTRQQAKLRGSCRSLSTRWSTRRYPNITTPPRR